ncbi:MAG TPA: AraC family transcriptional regulator [Prolixibacteraceae bacterium]|nr:AraC family transcriptional regulator [Prolixibacteraceae bacterium]
MLIYIKNMVCNRCVMVVSSIFRDAGLHETEVQLGKVQVKNPISTETLKEIEIQLKKVGFEIINDSKVRIIEQVKNYIIDLTYIHSAEIKSNYSDYLAGQLHLDYNYLSTLFSSVEGTTIEKYMINLKIERVKELLVYDEKTLSEIALEMGYSSVAHLSGQFKKVTGFTPSYFKKIGNQKRKPVDKV